MRRVGLFGGSFDPPHRGHRALVEAALGQLGLAEVWVIPAGEPVHRKLTPQVTAVQRLRWVRSLFADMPKIRVLDWEVAASYPVPTIDTLQRAHAQLQGDIPLLLMGMDAWAAMESWRGYPQHRALCNVAVFFRQGIVPVTLPGWHEMSLEQWRDGLVAAGHVVYVRQQLPDISATGLRRQLRAGDMSFTEAVAADARDELLASYGTAPKSMDVGTVPMLEINE